MAQGFKERSLGYDSPRRHDDQPTDWPSAPRGSWRNAPVYVRSPEHVDSPPLLHVGRLTHIFLEHEIKRKDSRIPDLYKAGEIQDSIPYFFQLTAITEVNRETGTD